MSNILQEKWKDLSAQYSKLSRDGTPVIKILKEGIKIEASAKFQGTKLGRTNLGRATKILKDYVYKIGIHVHVLDRKGLKTVRDGDHCHAFVLPDGELVIAEIGGQHHHDLGHSTADLITESGEHSHGVELPDGRKIETSSEDSIHDHQLIVGRTCCDGIHTHQIVLSDGTKIDSMWAGEFWDYLSDSPETLSGFDLSSELSMDLADKLAAGTDPTQIERSNITKEDYEPLLGKNRLQEPALQVAVNTDDLALNFKVDELFSWAQVRNPIGIHPVLSRRRVTIEKKGESLSILENANPGKVLEILSPIEYERLRSIEDDFALEAYLVNEDGSARLFVVDLLYLNENLTAKKFRTRRERLIQFFAEILVDFKKIGLLEVRWVDTMSTIQEALRWSLANEVSLGALAKSASGPYPLRGKTSDWYNIKKETPSLQLVAKKFDETTILAAAALGYNIEEISKIEDPEPDPKLVDIVKVQVAKINEDKKIVLGVVLEPMFMDSQEDIMTSDDIEKTAHDYLANHRVIGFRHKTRAKAVLVESYIAPVDFELNGQLVKQGTWIVGIFVEDDELWQDIRSGKINGFSVGGYGAREELT